MAATFELEFTGATDEAVGVTPGFFAWVDGAPAEGYRAPRTLVADAAQAPPASSCAPGGADTGAAVQIGVRRDAPVGIITSTYGARVLGPLLAAHPRDDVRLVVVENRYFGGNIGVAGLLVGADIARALADEPAGHRYLLPDVCLSRGRFLDGSTPESLPRPVEIVATDGIALRAALERGTERRRPVATAGEHRS